MKLKVFLTKRVSCEKCIRKVKLFSYPGSKNYTIQPTTTDRRETAQNTIFFFVQLLEEINLKQKLEKNFFPFSMRFVFNQQPILFLLLSQMISFFFLNCCNNFFSLLSQMKTMVAKLFVSLLFSEIKIKINQINYHGNL